MQTVVGTSGFTNNINGPSGSEEIRGMLEARKVAIEDLDLKEEIGKGENHETVV